MKFETRLTDGSAAVHPVEVAISLKAVTNSVTLHYFITRNYESRACDITLQNHLMSFQSCFINFVRL
jgi:hypothetical protein